jgi:hypothetical protein
VQHPLLDQHELDRDQLVSDRGGPWTLRQLDAAPIKGYVDQWNAPAAALAADSKDLSQLMVDTLQQASRHGTIVADVRCFKKGDTSGNSPAHYGVVCIPGAHAIVVSDHNNVTAAAAADAGKTSSDSYVVKGRFSVRNLGTSSSSASSLGSGGGIKKQKKTTGGASTFRLDWSTGTAKEAGDDDSGSSSSKKSTAVKVAGNVASMLVQTRDSRMITDLQHWVEKSIAPIYERYEVVRYRHELIDDDRFLVVQRVITPAAAAATPAAAESPNVVPAAAAEKPAPAGKKTSTAASSATGGSTSTGRVSKKKETAAAAAAAETPAADDESK